MVRVSVAVAGDADSLYAILAERAAWLHERRIAQWQSPYPRPLFDSDVSQGRVLAIRTENDASRVGTVTIYREAPEYYPRELRFDPSAPTVCRLAVALAFRGQGLGREIMAFLVADQASRGARKLRLDVVAANPFLQTYYEALGFQAILRASIFATPSIFMERDLTSPQD